MIGKTTSIGLIAILGTSLFPLLVSFAAAGSEEACLERCIDLAVEEALRIRSLPERTTIYTLDAQEVPLKLFFHQCKALFPWCCLFRKFYHWHSEIKTFTRSTPGGRVNYTVRFYLNGFSHLCPEISDPLKTHGDVAEYYHENGRFLGLGVYMGDGVYCPLPYPCP